MGLVLRMGSYNGDRLVHRTGALPTTGNLLRYGELCILKFHKGYYFAGFLGPPVDEQRRTAAVIPEVWHAGAPASAIRQFSAGDGDDGISEKVRSSTRRNRQVLIR
jgi:hypothetical protein